MMSSGMSPCAPPAIRTPTRRTSLSRGTWRIAPGTRSQGVLTLVQGLATGNSEDEKCAALIALSDAMDAPVTLSGDVLELSVSMEERRSLAKEDKALGPEGDFPIPDKGHLISAIARYKQGRLAGHPKSAVHAHIVKNAKRLGVAVTLAEGMTTAMTTPMTGTPRRACAMPSPGSSQGARALAAAVRTEAIRSIRAEARAAWT